jgi:hypothetical protein
MGFAPSVGDRESSLCGKLTDTSLLAIGPAFSNDSDFEPLRPHRATFLDFKAVRCCSRCERLM